MTAVALALADDPRLVGGLPPRRLVNLMVEEGAGEGGKALVARPALAAFAAAGSGPVWGVFQALSGGDPAAFNGDLFVVSGTGLYRVTTASGPTVTKVGDFGAIPVYGVRSVASPESGQRAFLIGLADGSNVLWVYGPPSGGGAAVLTAVTAFADTGGALPTWGDITYLAGRFVLTAQYTQQFYWSEIEDAGTINALNFASADAAPGFLLSCVQVGGQIALLATDHVEWWQPSSDANAPFLRGQGQGYARGTAATDSAVVLDNALFWVGDDKVVYRSGAVPQRVSNRGVEEQLRAAGGGLYIATASAVELDGHAWYVLNVPGRGTWAYDAATSGWARWQSGVVGSDPAALLGGCWNGGFACPGPFSVNYVADGPGVGGLGGSGSGAIWQTAPGGLVDVGPGGPLPLVRTVTGWAAVPSGRPRCDNVSLQASGTAGAALVVGLRWSDDQGATWSDSKALGPGQGGRLVRNRLGRMASPGRAFEWTWSDPVAVSVESAELNTAFP